MNYDYYLAYALYTLQINEFDIFLYLVIIQTYIQMAHCTRRRCRKQSRSRSRSRSRKNIHRRRQGGMIGLIL